MTRFTELRTKDDLPPDAHPIFDAIAESRGSVRGPFAVLLHSPELAGRVARLGAFVRFESGLPEAMRELSVLVGAHTWRCEYEWGAHLPLARAAGVRPEAIEAVASDAGLEAFTPDEALMVRFTLALITEHRVDEATLAEMRARYGDRGVIELSAGIGYYSMLACVLNVAELPGPAAT